METKEKKSRAPRKSIDARAFITAYNGVTTADKLTQKNVTTLIAKFGLTKLQLIQRARYLRAHGVKSLKPIERATRANNFKELEVLAKSLVKKEVAAPAQTQAPQQAAPAQTQAPQQAAVARIKLV